ncbi:hypothetical protein [Burkholderia glumae]|uniref:Uncharacterized protein n=1 Tax=Burkholderia glumae TaxID=337 RepID=A0AAP9XX40_BURGL|nr:hypothetical protein [Burkholderia glumae]MCM2483923.1 hypothetical protein [Burkholderia glumae]MCM2494271.1 hypothetical protein [Burkholderia glumae]MCM2509616.1 hypothetical protein [Burkholderia glumae]MCM2539378.1 hypothetical protein [Burkholderia glumae]MCM2545218.1 hypothetical protein [Burkholderia glumae]
MNALAGDRAERRRIGREQPVRVVLDDAQAMPQRALRQILPAAGCSC